MKSRLAMLVRFVVLLAALMPLKLLAQHHHYKLIDVGTFGGALSAINFSVDINGKAVNEQSLTVGFSETAVPRTPTSNHLICGGDDGFGTNITHAFAWLGAGVVDLGSLPPSETDCSNAYQVNANGVIVGFSENGQVDPFTGFNQSRAVRWINGTIQDLGSFGGNQNEALGLNNHGQLVGFSLNTIPDPYSFFDFLLLFPNPPNGTQTRAVLWQKGQMQDLGTLGTGNDAVAFMINERGQIAGGSYVNTTPNPDTGLPTMDPFLWENGKMIDLGSFGGAFGLPNYLNNRGQVVGGSSVAAEPAACFFEDTLNCHPFLWEKGNLLDLAITSKGGVPQTADGINDAGEIIGGADFSANGGSPFDGYSWKSGIATDLGTLAGDCGSRAMGINSQGEIVGHTFSCPDFPFHHAVLWEHGSMVDLNDLIPRDSPLQLAFSNDINNRGEIVGMGVPAGVDPSNVLTQGHAFLLIPCDEAHPGIEGCDYNMVESSAVASVSPAVREAPRRVPPAALWRRNNRFHFPAFNPRT